MRSTAPASGHVAKRERAHIDIGRAYVAVCLNSAMASKADGKEVRSLLKAAKVALGRKEHEEVARICKVNCPYNLASVLGTIPVWWVSVFLPKIEEPTELAGSSNGWQGFF